MMCKLSVSKLEDNLPVLTMGSPALVSVNLLEEIISTSQTSIITQPTDDVDPTPEEKMKHQLDAKFTDNFLDIVELLWS